MNPDTHFYLYAKGHYESNNVTIDLCRIMEERCGLSEGQVSVYVTVDCLISITFPHILNSGNPENTFSEFIQRIYKGDTWWIGSFNEGMSTIDRTIRSCLSIIKFVKVTDIPDLGHADDKILPLSEYSREKRRKEVKKNEDNNL